MADIIARPRATIDDLYAVDGKAEIVNGEIVHLMATGIEPGYAGDEIYSSLRHYAKSAGIGRAVADNKGFHVRLPNRESFSPDAAYFIGPTKGMKFFEGAPVFAAEVRGEFDYGPFAERGLAAKRADYFAAGTKVVWDVDLLSVDIVRVYRFDDPDRNMIYRRGDYAEAEPAVPGWTMFVDDLLED